ncbi:protein FAM8A1 isoform X2 [Tachysurus fulvidraco]|uniref:protein FAM8A1 isoform X2 n=1 Tax=Tachysurus fulvidraco TaxID=1234273 RepID=UPI000F4EB9A1|nr:protein FAM8A1 isoform X2 [Tachysurus fulvidraco]
MADSLDEGANDSKKAVCGTNRKEMNAITESGSRRVSNLIAKSQYCEKLQEWMWQYYCGYVSYQSWGTQAACGSLTTPTGGADLSNTDLHNWITYSSGVPFASFPSIPVPSNSTAANSVSERQIWNNVPSQNGPVPLQVQQNGNAQQPGGEYFIPSLLHRFLAEIVDFFILFFIKATIILSIMQLSGMKDILKFAMHFIVEEIDEDTSMEDLQKMMLMALVYRILVCFYEIICVWGAGGATPGKFLLGLRVVTCDTSVLVQPGRVRVVPATNVSLSASTIRALNKNFSIAFFFPAFVTLLFYQHNRTVYDIVAGTIVVKRNRLR